MLIFLRESNGNGFTIEVNPNQPVFSIFTHLNDLGNENTEKYDLYLKGKIIDNPEKSFLETKIKQNDILHIQKIVQNNQKQTHINLSIFYNNESYSFRINNQESISKLKYRIFEVIKIYPKEQYLVFRGKKLQQNLTLMQENIQNDALISLIHIEKKQSILKSSQNLPCAQNQLLESITSVKLNKKVSIRTKTSLYRSDSIGSKNPEERVFPEIQVKYLNNYMDLAASVESEMQIGRFLYNNGNEPSVQCTQPFQQYQSMRQKTQFLHPIQIHQDKIQSSDDQEESLYKKLKLQENSLFESLDYSQIQNQIKNNKLNESEDFDQVQIC